MRQIILDIETTGLNPDKGDRIIEIGCVELINRNITENNLHLYINPNKKSTEKALSIHGLTSSFLKKKPNFSQIVKIFYNYVKNTEIIIHNSSFDVSFLNKEFNLLNLKPFTKYVKNIVDSLKIARDKYPGQKNSLDALCDRYKILNIRKGFHGALIDAKLLTMVYLAMTSKQNNFNYSYSTNYKFKKRNNKIFFSKYNNKKNNVILANKNELKEHNKILNNIEKKNKKKCIWNILKF